MIQSACICVSFSLDTGISVCRCTDTCSSKHVEVAFIPFQAIIRMRHVQTTSKKGYNYLAIETSEDGSATFVIYAKHTKQIKAAINVRFNALTGHAAQEAQSEQSEEGMLEAGASTSIPVSIADAAEDAFGGEDPFLKYVRVPAGAETGEYAQGEWWK